MIKNCVVIEEQENGRDFKLVCPVGCSWQDVMSITSRIYQFADVQVKTQEKPKEEKTEVTQE